MFKNIYILALLVLPFQAVFSQPVNTNISNGIMFDGEPVIAVNPVNNQGIVAAWMGMEFSNGEFRIAIKTRASFNGGTSWSPVHSFPHFGNGYGSADPSLAFDKNGLLYTCYIDYRQLPDSGGVYVSRSADGGLSWDAPSKAFDMYDVPGKRPIDRPWLVVDNSNTSNAGTLYITTKPAPWIAPPNRAYYKVSSDSGHTWTTLANIDGGNHLTGDFIVAPMASPATTVNGKFCAIYPSYVPSQNPLPAFYLASSTDKGQTFIYTTLLSSLFPPLDTNFKNGYYLMTHPADSNKMIFLLPNASNGDEDIMALHSNDGGQSWSSMIRVNDDPVGNGKAQDMVWAAYNEQGKIVVTWRDRRNSDVTGFWNAGYDFYYACSTDNGQTFSANRKLSTQFIAFDSIIAANGNDFMSCAYRGDTLYTVWGDTRNSKMNIWFSKTTVSTNEGIIITLLDGEESPLTIFPNPARNELNIRVSGKLIGEELLICDASGKQIFKTFITGKDIKINSKDFPRGSYFVKIGNLVKRVISEE
jgi:Secretion system C-terminal sorting domain